MARIRPIPVGDATDLGAATPSTLKGAGFDMGPGNPNVPPAGSPEAQAFKASQQPFVGPPAPASPRGVPPLADRINGVANTINDVNARQGAAVAQKIDNVTQGVKNATAGIRNTGNAVGNLAGAVFNNPLVRVGGAALGGYSAVNEAGDAQASFDKGDTVSGVNSGLRSAVSAASMLPSPVGLGAASYMGGQAIGGVIDRQLQKSQGGLEFRDKIGSLFASPEERFKVAEANRFTQGLAANTPFTPGAPPQAAPVAPPTLVQPAAPGVVSPTGPGPAPTTSTGPLVSRQGNNFSGTNIREGFRYEDGPGSRPSTGMLSVVSGGGAGGFGPNSTLGGAVAPPDDGAPRFSAAGGIGGSTIGSDLRAKTEAGGGTIRDMMRLGLSARQAQSAITAADDRTERARATDIGANTQRYGTDVNAGVQTRGQDIGANVSIRGQDMTFAANKANNRLAVFQAQRDQANKDREFGAGRSDADFAQRGAREQALQRNIESIAPIGQDGKPDPNFVRDARAGFDRSAARLGVNGPHELSPRVEQQLLAAHSLLGTMKANAGLLPWKPDKLKTIDPVDLTDLRVLPNGDRQITRKDSKAMGQVIPSRFFDTEEGNRIRSFGTPTNRYDMLSAQGAQQ